MTGSSAGERPDRSPSGGPSPGVEAPVEPPPGVFGALNPQYRISRRQQRIREAVARSRRGDHPVPTWVLALILLVVLAGLTVLVLVS